jgi:hypothetical protein
MRVHGLLVVAIAAVVLTAAAAAQQPAQAPPPQEPIILGPPPPPATALEAFLVPSGTVLFTSYEDLGDVAGVFVEARELREGRGPARRVRGIVVTIAGRQPNPEQAYVDPDEFANLLRGFDALLAITTNPSGQWRNFDMRYSTRGELVLTASSTRNRGVLYGVEVGRVLHARRTLNGGEFHQLRTLVEAAQQKLATLPEER